MIKILILTQERSGGTSLIQILNEILSIQTNSLIFHIDDPYTYIKRNITLDFLDLSKYKNTKQEDINYVEILNYIFNSNVHIVKISITYLSMKQIEDIKQFIKEYNVFSISLINNNIFKLTTSYAIACILQNFDIKNEKKDINIDEIFFIEKYIEFKKYYILLKELSLITDYTINFNEFYTDIKNLDNIVNKLKFKDLKYNDYILKVFNKDYRSYLINVLNIEDLKKKIENIN